MNIELRTNLLKAIGGMDEKEDSLDVVCMVAFAEKLESLGVASDVSRISAANLSIDVKGVENEFDEEEDLEILIQYIERHAVCIHNSVKSLVGEDASKNTFNQSLLGMSRKTVIVLEP